MYAAVTASIVGQALLFESLALVLRAAVAAAAMIAFARGYEEPTLRRQFSAEYEAYRRAVPGWWPRRRAWRPDRTAAREDADGVD